MQTGERLAGRPTDSSNSANPREGVGPRLFGMSRSRWGALSVHDPQLGCTIDIRTSRRLDRAAWRACSHRTQGAGGIRGGKRTSQGPENIGKVRRHRSYSPFWVTKYAGPGVSFISMSL